VELGVPVSEGVLVCEELPVPVWDEEPVPVPVWLGVPVLLELGVPVCVLEGVPVGVDVPVWLEEGVPVCVELGVPDTVPVTLELGVPVPVVVDEGVRVVDGELVCVGVPVWLEEGVPEPVWEAVWLDEGVHVGVMLAGTRHTRTLSTRSSEDSLPSCIFAMLKLSTCQPGSTMVSDSVIHGDTRYSPILSTLRLKLRRMVTLPEGATSDTLTKAVSLKGSASWPTKRTSDVRRVEARVEASAKKVKFIVV